MSKPSKNAEHVVDARARELSVTLLRNLADAIEGGHADPINVSQTRGFQRTSEADPFTTSTHVPTGMGALTVEFRYNK